MKIQKLFNFRMLLVAVLWLFQSIPVSAQLNQKSLLWEISGNGLKQKSYLFGTIHIISKKEFFLTDVMKEKFKSCDALATEVNMDIPLGEQLKMAQSALLPESHTIEDLIEVSAFEALRSFMIDSLGISKSKFKKYIRLKPFFLSAVLSSKMSGKVVAYEKVFFKMAKRNHMQTLGLETLEYQMSLVNAVPNDQQAKTLISGLGSLSDFRKSEKAMVDAYKDQDIDKLYEFITSQSSTDKSFEQDFITTRNHNWVPVIKKMISEQSTFIAVGAGHLGGPGGMVQLLLKEGYNVTAVQ
ncbi:MAG: TraB/GumN family protein [Bacteroidota bacterium]